MATKPKTTSGPEETIALYDKLIEAIPGLERKGAKFPYTSLNGHMFSMIDGEYSLALRLPKDTIEAFLKKYKTTYQESHGVVRKEYAVVPDKLLKNTKEL